MNFISIFDNPFTPGIYASVIKLGADGSRCIVTVVETDTLDANAQRAIAEYVAGFGIVAYSDGDFDAVVRSDNAVADAIRAYLDSKELVS